MSSRASLILVTAGHLLGVALLCAAVVAADSTQVTAAWALLGAGVAVEAAVGLACVSAHR